MFLHSVEDTGISWKIQLPGDLDSWTVTPRAQRFGTDGAFIMKLPCYSDKFFCCRVVLVKRSWTITSFVTDFRKS